MTTDLNLRQSLTPEQLDGDPIIQFNRWFNQATLVADQANAMTLATVGANGQPAARIVLLRGIDSSGFVFFSNYQSRKGEDLEHNQKCALLFFWPQLKRQVRIEGMVEKISPLESDDYFSSRPRGNQLAAHASPQSRIIADRDELEKRCQACIQRFLDQEVPRPPHWGGYRLVPTTIEFWQEGEHRLHDRLRYQRQQRNWKIERLAP